MSPFTGDAIILERVLRGESGIWRDVSGNIQLIRIFDRLEFIKDSQLTKFKIEIIIAEVDSSLDISSNEKTCTFTFQIEAFWDFMALKEVIITKL